MTCLHGFPYFNIELLPSSVPVTWVAMQGEQSVIEDTQIESSPSLKTCLVSDMQANNADVNLGRVFARVPLFILTAAWKKRVCVCLYVAGAAASNTAGALCVSH